MKIKQIDITKPKLDFWWLATLFIIVVVALGIWHLGNWAFGQVKGLTKPAEETLAGTLPD